MKTTHLTTIVSHFNPLAQARAHLIPRLLLARLPSSPIGAGGTAIKITTKILTAASGEPARLTVGFKGGEEVTFVEATRKLNKVERKKLRESGKVEEGTSVLEETRADMLKEGIMDLGRMSIKDVLEELSRRSRVLGRKEMIAGGG